MANKLEVNPWRSIWIEPRSTIREIVKFNPKHQFIWLSIIYGFPMILNFAQSYSFSEMLPLWATVLAALILSGFAGALGIVVISALLTWTGRWIGGKGTFQTVRCAVAWSNTPNIVTILMWGVLIGVFGNQLFYREFADSVFIGYESGIVFLVFLIESIVSIWGIVILLKGLSEVQGFSVWRAVVNVIIPILLMVAFIWIMGWIFSGTHTNLITVVT